MTVNFTMQLQRQLLFLRNSSRLYDDGCIEEAIRLATSLRVLFHNTRSSTSLLSHLNAGTWKLVSSASLQEGAINPLCGMTLSGADQRLRCFPRINNVSRWEIVEFATWWDCEIVITAEGCTLTRKQLILAAANKDGGAHVDEELDPNYRLLVAGVSQNAIGMQEADGYSISPRVEELQFASLRQIAHEVLNSSDLLLTAFY